MTPPPLGQKPQQDEQKVDALSLPEIIQSIGMFLDNNATRNCLHVCHQWCQVLLPSIWTTVELDLDPVAKKGPNFPELDKHSSLIQVLNITFRLRFNLPGGNRLFCPNLTTLHIYDRYGDRPFLNEESLCLLIQRHASTLEFVKLHTFISDEVLDSVEGCLHLNHLELVDQTPVVDLLRWIDRYDILWSRPRTFLWIGSSPLPRPPGLSLDTRLAALKSTRIRHLTLSADRNGEPLVGAHVLLIQKSPELERLRWIIHGKEQPHLRQMARLAQACRSNLLSQQLESLVLPLHGEFSNQDLQVVLESLPSLTDLDLNYSSFDLGSWRSLQSVPRLMHQLKRLDLYGCRDATGAVLQEILCSISTLEEFHGNHVRDTDILTDDRPWICRGMKSLRLAFVLIEPGQQQNSEIVILSRLSTLDRLESLFLEADYLLANGTGTIPLGEWRHNSLQLTLEHGLDRLKTLRRLKSIGGPSPFLPVWTGEAEAQWVLEHWVSLKSIKHISLDPKAQELLRRFAPEGGWPRSHCR